MLLTSQESYGNLITVSEKILNGVGLSKNNGASRSMTAVFFCAKSQFIIMLNWVDSRKTGRLRCTDRPICSVRLHDWPHVVGFKTITTTEAIMPKQFNAKNPKKSNTPTLNVRLKSLFMLLDANKRTIAYNLPFEQVKSIADDLSGSIIKPQKWSMSNESI